MNQNKAPELKDADTDLVVIGTGGGGMGAALEAARLGKKVTIIERSIIGGSCVNVGCIPSKAMIKPANFRHHALNSVFKGLQYSDKENDWQQLLKDRKQLVEHLRQEKYEKVLDQFDSITLKKENATFDVDSAGYPIGKLDDGSIIKANRYVIATGSRNTKPDVPGVDEVELLDSTTALFLDKKPESLIVIGGGFIAVELGQALHRLGIKIVSMEARSRLLSKWDLDLSNELLQSFMNEGIPVNLGSVPVRFFNENKLKCVEMQDAQGNKRILKAEQILIAMGRVANTDELNLESVGVKVEKGTAEIAINSQMQTTNPSIYAVGDCSTLPNLVYLAAKSGKLASANAFDNPIGEIDFDNIPEVVFSDPQCARVGLTLKEAKAAGIDAKESKLGMDNVPKAIVSNTTGGFIKLIADNRDNTLIGAHIISENAGDLIQTVSLAIAMGKKHEFTVNDFREMLFPYLTEVEGLKLAAQTFDMKVGQLSCCAG